MKRSFLILSVLGVMGCQQNPYNQPGVPSSEQKPKRPELPPYSIQVADQLVFEEGKETKYGIEGSVTDGSPILIFKGLPQGAVFDTKTNELVWTPGYDAADDANQPRLTRKYIPVQVSVASSVTPSTRFEKTVTLVVIDTPRPISAAFNSSTFSEGSASRGQIVITDKDLPNGPFIVTASGLPTGAVITPTNDPKIYDVIYTPDPLAVRQSRAGQKGFQIKVINPRGYMGDFTFNMNVQNVLADPVISGPTDVMANSDVTFEFNVVDPNNEDYPTAALSTYPRDGKVELNEISRTTAPTYSRRYSLTWRNIPVSAANRTEPFSFKVCSSSVYASPSSKCVNYAVDVVLSSEGRLAPTVDRSKWPLGQTRYVKQGGFLSVPLSISSNSSGRIPLSVSFNPPSLAPYLTWQNNALNVSIPNPGVYQFDMTASVGQATQKESFVVEVLPKDWAQNLVISSGTTSTDANAMLTNLTSAQLVVPSLYPLDERMMTERKGIFLGPEAIANHDVERVNNVLVQGSGKKIFIYGTNIADLPQALKQALATANVGFAGQVDIATNGQPNALQLGTSSRLTPNKQPIFLKGTVPVASPKVASFTLGSGPCVSVLEMVVPNQTTNTVLAVSCSQNNTTMIFAGFHWSDIAFDQTQDRDLVKNWIEGMLNQ